MNGDKRKLFFWPITALLFLITFVVLPLSAWASPVPDYRPDWWSNADAKVSLDTPAPGTSGGGIADGSKGYAYTWMTLTFFDSDPEDGGRTNFLTVWLDNDENQNMTKKFWLAVHFSEAFSELPDSDPPTITGYYEDGTYKSLTPNVDDVVLAGNWVYWEPSMFPQPDRETFVIQTLGDYLNPEKTNFTIDYVEMGTYCVPIPSTLLLLSGGLLSIAGLRRKLRK